MQYRPLKAFKKCNIKCRSLGKMVKTDLAPITGMCYRRGTLLQRLDDLPYRPFDLQHKIGIRVQAALALEFFGGQDRRMRGGQREV